MYKFIPSGNRFSIILSNRTSDYTSATRGLFIISFIKLKNHRRCFTSLFFLFYVNNVEPYGGVLNTSVYKL